MTAIVLIHGFPLDSSMWAQQVAALTAAGHEVLTPDVGGLGLSEVPAGEPDIHSMAQQVVDAMHTVGWERAVIGGLSMGGYVAMAMLRVAPERLAGLVLMDTKAGADDPVRRQTRRDTAHHVRSAASTEALARSMPTSLLSQYSMRTHPQLAVDIAQTIRRATPEAVAWCQEAMASRPDSLTTLRSAGSLPSLVVCGEEDAVTPVTEHRQVVAALRDAGGNPQLHVIPSAGHLSPMEQPQVVNQTLLDFLDTMAVRAS